jgi:hypothetical protein
VVGGSDDVKHVLCISPHFPPVNAADMQRLRQALPYLPEFGWQPSVIAVEPKHCEGLQDPLLMGTLPNTVGVVQTGAFPARLTRIAGLGNLGFRCWPHLRTAGHRFLTAHRVDLVFFTTTVFTAIAHGPAWQKRHGVPFVVDLQDPWRNDYYLSLPRSLRPPKFEFDYWQKARLEASTMPSASGIVAVSQSYIDQVQERYPGLRGRPAIELPFAVLPGDMEVARTLPSEPARAPGTVVLRYVGRGGPDMARAAIILFTALARGVEKEPERFKRLRLEFIGTSYAAQGRGQQTIRHHAERLGVAAQVTEDPDRRAYFRALRNLLDADGLIILGSDDTRYTASKLYPYILADRPLLALFHAESPAAAVLRETCAGRLVTFDAAGDDDAVAQCTAELGRLAERPPPEPIDHDAFARYGARAMTEKLARLFDEVAAANKGATA